MVRGTLIEENIWLQPWRPKKWFYQNSRSTFFRSASRFTEDDAFVKLFCKKYFGIKVCFDFNAS